MTGYRLRKWVLTQMLDPKMRLIRGSGFVLTAAILSVTSVLIGELGWAVGCAIGAVGGILMVLLLTRTVNNIPEETRQNRTEELQKRLDRLEAAGPKKSKLTGAQTKQIGLIALGAIAYAALNYWLLAAAGLLGQVLAVGLLLMGVEALEHTAKKRKQQQPPAPRATNRRKRPEAG